MKTVVKTVVKKQIGVIGAGSCGSEIKALEEMVGTEVAKKELTLGILPETLKEQANPWIDITVSVGMTIPCSSPLQDDYVKGSGLCIYMSILKDSLDFLPFHCTTCFYYLLSCLTPLRLTIHFLNSFSCFHSDNRITHVL